MGAAASVSAMDERTEKENGATCKICSVSVNFITRQKCEECFRYFCSKCIEANSHSLFKSIPKRCKRCVLFLSGTLTRVELLRFTIEDLRLYLSRRTVNTRNCFEKSDLIELVLQTRGAGSIGGVPSSGGVRGLDDSEHARHVQQLIERQRNDSAVRSNVSPGQGPVPRVPLTTQESPSSNQSRPTQPIPSRPTSSVPSRPTSSASNRPTSSASSRPAASETFRPGPPAYDNVINHRVPSGTQAQGLNPNAVSDEQSSVYIGEPTNVAPSPLPTTTRRDPSEGGSADTNQDNNTSSVERSGGGGGGSQNERVKLSSIKTREDIERLTIRQLKELLVTHYVDYKGCCEKGELLERVHRLWRETCRNQEIEPDRVAEDDLCKICMDAVIDCLLLECGHMVTCTQCGKRMAECPVCRMYVSRVVHVFRA